MKRVIAMFLILAGTLSAAEIFDEFYVMEKLIPLLEKSSTYSLNGREIKAIKVDKKVLKSLGTTSSPFYFYDSKNEKTKAKIGDYIVAPLSLAEIYSLSEEKLQEKK